MAGADSSQLRALAADMRKAGQIKSGMSVAVRKTLADIETDAKVLAPVDTGNLRNSINTELDGDGLGGVVGPTAEYGIYQELGTSTMGAQPFLGPAFDRRVPALGEAIGQLAARFGGR